MFKNIILNYAEKLTIEDIYSFRKNNNIEASNKDINIIYKYIKKYKDVFLENPEKYILMIKKDVSPSCYNEILKYYEKYKKSI